jgi:hypothetical protein
MMQSLHRLTDKCYIDRLSRALTNLFARIDHVFKLFCNQADDAIYRRTISPAFRTTAQCLVCEWGGFVASFNSLAEQHLSPHIDHFTRLFTSLVGQLDQAQDLAKVGILRTLASGQYFRDVRAEAISLRSCAFDDPVFLERVSALVNDVAAIFHHSVPLCTMATSEIILLRTTLKAICTEIARVAIGATVFPKLLLLARVAIARASRELNSTLESLKLPFNVLVPFDLDESSISDDFSGSRRSSRA